MHGGASPNWFGRATFHRRLLTKSVPYKYATAIRFEAEPHKMTAATQPRASRFYERTLHEASLLAALAEAVFRWRRRMLRFGFLVVALSSAFASPCLAQVPALLVSP